MKISSLTLLLIGLWTATFSYAHDTWVETHTNLIRTGDAIYIDLKLGNHGNEHRDFKLASKVDLEFCTFDVTEPSGKTYDLKATAIDTGYAPKEGYWKAKFVPAKIGMYRVSHTLEMVLNHGHPLRAIKSGKTYFVATDSLDRPTQSNVGFDKPLGHPLELVPTANPVTPMGPGQPIALQVLFKGQPLPEARVSFVPRGEVLAEGFDETYERLADENGNVEFIPKTGNHYLAVVHHRRDDEKTDTYDYTAYSATLTIFVPEICPCCGAE